MLSEIGHIAIIMDGNGRWAQKRSRPRFWGHVRGSRVVSEIIETADSLNIKALTLYAFSTENWSRPTDEIKVLFQLLKKYVIREAERVMANNIWFKVIGDISKLPTETKQLIKSLEEKTKFNSGLKLNFAFGYGGQKEIVDAVNFYIAQNPGNPLCEEDIEKRLLTNGVGNVDLLIRTGGEHRISNFLLWQNAYAELRFSPTFWPDFGSREFTRIIENFCRSNRRFGGLNSEVVSFEKIKRKVTTYNSSIVEGEVTVVPLGETAKRQRKGSETCSLHTGLGWGGASKGESDDCHGRAKAVTLQGSGPLRGDTKTLGEGREYLS